MKAPKTYLKGKSVFIVSLLVIGITITTVYLTGENYNRSLTRNFYFSLGIIGTALFVFMTYGLYKGIGLVNNFPEYRNFKRGDYLPSNIDFPELPEVGDGIEGLILAILLWIVMTICFIVLLLFLEAIFWFSIFIIIAMLYWLFFRALRLVFSTSKDTMGSIINSVIYSFSYTVLYTGWLFVIVYLAETIR